MNEVHEELARLPRHKLQSFAEAHGLDGAAERSKPELVTALTGLGVETLRPLLAAAPIDINAPGFRLGQSMAALQHEVAELRKAQTKEEDIFDRVDERVALHMHGVDQLKWFFAAIGACLAVLTAVGAGLGNKKFSDFEELSTKQREALEELSVKQKVALGELREKDATMDSRTSAHLAASLSGAIVMSMDDCRSLMDLMTSWFRPPGLNERVKHRQALIRSLVADSAGVIETNEALSMLQTLDRLYTCIGETPKLDEVKPYVLEQELGALRDIWERLVIPEFESDLFGAYAQEIESWRLNTLGVIEIRAYRKLPAERTVEVLDRANGFLGGALRKNRFFARAYMNLAVVNKLRFDLERKRAREQGRTGYPELLHYFEDAQALLEDASRYEQASGGVSIALNNSAYYYLSESQFLYEHGDMQVGSEAQARLVALMEKAKERITAARAAFPVSPAVYTTQAEILCMEIKLEDAFPPEESELRLEKILGLLREARSGGYTGLSGIKVEQILERTPVYGYLALLQVANWDRRLWSALNES